VPGTRIELVQGQAPRDFKSEKGNFEKSTISSKCPFSLNIF